jgi:predicted esterase
MALNPETVHYIKVQRTARYVVLGARDAHERWMVLHGYGQLSTRFSQKFAPFAHAQRCFIVAEALNRFYVEGFSGKVGATWMTSEERETDVSDNMAYLDALFLNTPGHCNAFFGFSQGVATLCRWLKHRLPSAHKIVFWAGSVAREMEHWTQEDASVFQNTELIYVFGTQDRFFDEIKIKAQLDTLERLKIPFKVVRFEGGHHIKSDILKEVLN